MTDLAKTIAPKSDQLNADDLIAGPRTITITGVRGNDDPDQPISINFEGDGGKPYKPCKSMRRVMVHCWGADGKTYAGRRATLYCDQGVQFGGIKVGGIRISHLSHIDREMIMALTVTRAKRAPYKVLPLRADVKQGPTASRGHEPRPAPSREAEGTPSEETIYSGGFGAESHGSPPADDEVSDTVRWARELQEDLEGDVFRSTAGLDAFTGDPKNQAMFQALQDEDPAYATRLNAQIRGRGKALASRGG